MGWTTRDPRAPAPARAGSPPARARRQPPPAAPRRGDRFLRALPQEDRHPQGVRRRRAQGDRAAGRPDLGAAAFRSRPRSSWWSARWSGPAGTPPRAATSPTSPGAASTTPRWATIWPRSATSTRGSSSPARGRCGWRTCWSAGWPTWWAIPPGAAGNIASGGSIANLTAIATARDAHGLRGRRLRVGRRVPHHARPTTASRRRSGSPGWARRRSAGLPMDDRLPDAARGAGAGDRRRPRRRASGPGSSSRPPAPPTPARWTRSTPSRRSPSASGAGSTWTRPTAGSSC